MPDDPKLIIPVCRCPICGIEHQSWTPHLTHWDIRKKIRDAGHPFIENLPSDLHNIAGTLMELNEDWTLLHPDSLGAELIISTGFTDNQKHFLERLVPLIQRNRPPRKHSLPGDEITPAFPPTAGYPEINGVDAVREGGFCREYRRMESRYPDPENLCVSCELWSTFLEICTADVPHRGSCPGSG